MAIAKDKVRAAIVLDKSDKEALEKLAKEDDRSLNYMVNKAVKEFLKKKKRTV